MYYNHQCVPGPHHYCSVIVMVFVCGLCTVARADDFIAIYHIITSIKKPTYFYTVTKKDHATDIAATDSSFKAKYFVQ